MDISGNPLTYPPPDVCTEGTTAIMDFLRRKLKQKEDEKELRKRFHRFSQIVTETREVEDLGVALLLTADEMTSIIQGSKNQNPSYQAYNMLLKWIEKDQEASMDQLQQELTDFGMDTLAEKASRTKAKPKLAERSTGKSGGKAAKRPATGGSSLELHQDEQQTKKKIRQEAVRIHDHSETQQTISTRVAEQKLSGQVGFSCETIEDMIKDNYELLSKRLQVEKLIPQFIQKRQLDFTDKQVIMSKITTQSRAEALLDLLIVKGKCTPETFVEILTRGDHRHIVDQLKRTSTQDEPTEGGKKKTKRRHGSQLSDNGTPAKRPKKVNVSTYFDKVVDGVSSDWDDLARKLNFTENQIKVIAEMRPDQNRRCREMLWTWRNRDGQAATLQALKKALINIKQKHLAERLEDYSDYSDSSESSDD